MHELLQSTTPPYVGNAEGERLRVAVGLQVGTKVGETEGLRVGVVVLGEAVGVLVLGEAVGVLVGATEGTY